MVGVGFRQDLRGRRESLWRSLRMDWARLSAALTAMFGQERPPLCVPLLLPGEVSTSGYLLLFFFLSSPLPRHAAALKGQSLEFNPPPLACPLPSLPQSASRLLASSEPNVPSICPHVTRRQILGVIILV